jgi:hypothetical protein
MGDWCNLDSKIEHVNESLILTSRQNIGHFLCLYLSGMDLNDAYLIDTYLSYMYLKGTRISMKHTTVPHI